MKGHIANKWQNILAYNNLDSFDKIWNVDAGWVEEPNQRRGGWSGVTKLELKHPVEGTCNVYIKRQQNHVTKSIMHPLRGVPTFQREAKNITRFTQHGIPTLTLVYYDERVEQGNLQAILITAELDGYQSLEQWLAQWETEPLPLRQKKQVIAKIAQVVRDMHNAGFRHGCLYPKHVFLKLDSETGNEVRVIDLEKARAWPIKHSRMAKDLGTLSRHSHCNSTDKLRFINYYSQQRKLTKEVKLLAEEIYKRKLKKDKARAKRQLA